MKRREGEESRERETDRFGCKNDVLKSFKKYLPYPQEPIADLSQTSSFASHTFWEMSAMSAISALFT